MRPSARWWGRRTAGVGLVLAGLLSCLVAGTGTASAAAGPAGGNRPQAPTLPPDRGGRHLREQDPEARPDSDAGTVLVKMKRGHGASELGRTVVRTIPHTGYALVRARDSAGRDLGRLQRDDRVDHAEPNYVATAFQVPNDPLLAKHKQPYLARLHLPAAWDRVHGDPSLKVAVVDTGVDADSPDLAGRVASGIDIVNGDADPADDEGHGTMVAGIVAAQAGNGIGIAGVAWSATVLPVKVLDETGTGTYADIATGIVWAADNGARIINVSAGGLASSDSLAEAVAYARSRDVVVVAAAGNAGAKVPSYPAAYPDVVAVAATDWDGNAAPFTSWGPWVDLAAPGIDITSTYPAPGTRPNYATGSGTSFAAPLVAGVAALVRAANPALNADAVIDRLESTARDVGPRGLDDAYGLGFLDADAALGGPMAPATVQPVEGPGEPNDVPARATPLGANGSATGLLDVEGDVDWYSIGLTAPGVLNASVAGPGYYVAGRYSPMDPRVEIFGPNLEPLSRAENVHGQIVHVSATGTYYIRVTSASPSRTALPYTVQAQSSADTEVPRFVAQTYGLPDEPQSSAIGDVTGDGRPDVLVTTGGYDGIVSYKLVLYRQLPDGWLDEPEFLDTSAIGNGQRGLAIGDLNGDGKADVALAADAGVDIYPQGDSGLGPPTLIDAPGASQVVAGDVNGDGRTDLAVGAQGNGAFVLLNTTNGWTRTPVTSVRQTQIALGDITSDGRTDVVGLTGSTVHVFPQAADGTFGPGLDTAASSSIAAAGIAVADLNGDGRQDVALSAGGNTPSSHIDVFAQTAAGTLAAPTALPSYDVPGPLAVGDLNGDGRADLVVTHNAWEKIGVYYQTPDGILSPEERQDVKYGNYSAQAVAVGDTNGDGAADITVADYQNGLTVLRRRTPTWPPPAFVAQSSTPADLATNVPTTTSPSVQLPAAVDPAAITASLIDGRTGSVVPGALSAAGATVTYQPAGALAAGRPYILRLGTPGLDPEIVVHFTTTGAAADTTAPDTFLEYGPPPTAIPTLGGFGFTSSEPGGRYECQEDGGDYWYACWAPRELRYQSAGTHTFAVRAVDAAGNVDPTPVTLSYTMQADPGPPPNDWPSYAQALTGTFGSVTGTNLGATEQNEPPVEGNEGGRSIWYSWTAPESGPTTFDTSGSSFDTLLGVYILTGGIDERGASDDVSVTDRTSRVTFDAVAGTTYYIAVDGFNNGFDAAMGTVQLNWRGPGAPTDVRPPTIAITSPADGARVPGFVQITADASDDTTVARVEFRTDGNLLATDTAAPYQATWDARTLPAGSSHQLEARAFDVTGKSATDTHTVIVDAAPPETTITSGPQGTVTSNTATFTFSANEPSIFFCRLESDYGYGTAERCTSPKTYSGLAGGNYTFDVHAVDTAGNPDDTSARRSWTLSNDYFAAATDLGNQGRLAGGNNTNATKEAGEPNHAGNRGGKSIWYVWHAPSTPQTVTVDTRNSNFDTLLAVYTGSSVGGLTAVAANDNDGSLSTSRVSFTSTPGTTYRIAVDGRNGRSGNVVLGLGIAAPAADTTPPDTTITSGPSGTTTATTATFAFGSTETGSTFQCHLDAAAFTACSSPASYAGLTPGSHTFYVRATDAAGNTDQTPASQTWTISTSSPTGPPNDMFASAQAASGGSGSGTGSNTGATKEAGEPNHAGNAGGKSIWYTWTPAQSGSATIDTVGSGFDTLLAVYTGTSVSVLTPVASDDDAGGNLTSKVALTVTAGTTYRIAIDGYGGASGATKLNWSLTASGGPANDMFANAQVISSASGTSAGSNTAATKETGEPNHAGNTGGKSIWYSWTAPAAGAVTIDTIGSSFDTLLGIYTGTSVAALNVVASNDDAAGGLQSKVTFTAAAGVTYRIAIDGYNAANGSIKLNWSAG